ncbi:unnamed protein product (macronuclear) [Paramecium tetraurelia]|uniref:C2 tensin-type domain-containing protein n=1 Tax=Paramecium tetraurelia TaxID=5888 RepID=A0ECP3_PARTE|nr:uncharacterized protein GSPATT00003929001 [Paramecium tetraurelia]CAK93060.1 unnamed protein product [Paramecium tetraurelia]|eukprot:XP_001460457.1 hypothetical protein (macronuclear) [Paramecium tetraurelia strain d4-2]
MDKLYNSLAPKFKGIANSYKSLASQTKQIASNTIDKLSKQAIQGDIVAISNRLFWMEYPSNDKIEKLSSYLNTNHQNHYYIWNVGEREFTTEWFCNQVANHSHPGYPCPPLIELLMICKNIIYFLSSDRNNIAIVCCQETRGRSIMVISSLLAIMGAGYPGECLLRVCEKTNTKDFQALFPSQHQYITYVGNVLNGLKLNSSCLRLISIVISGIPKVQNCTMFRPYIQLFKNDKPIFNSLTDGELKNYQQGDLSCIFDLKGIELSDDILIRCKHFENNKTRVALFRVMFNCSFLFDNVLRVWDRELDKSPQMKTEKDFFVDFIFERGNQKSFQTADRPQTFSNDTKSSNQLLLQIVQECKGLVVKEKHVIDGLEVQEQQQKTKEEVFSLGNETEKKDNEDSDEKLPQLKQQQNNRSPQDNIQPQQLFTEQVKNPPQQQQEQSVSPKQQQQQVQQEQKEQKETLNQQQVKQKDNLSDESEDDDEQLVAKFEQKIQTKTGDSDEDCDDFLDNLIKQGDKQE